MKNVEVGRVRWGRAPRVLKLISKFIIVLVAIVVTAGLSANASADDSFIKSGIVTASGPIKGKTVGDIVEFLGIPYAAAPIGALRWMPPQNFGRWHGRFKATRFGSQCPQSGGGSEDCLFLNVYEPKRKSHKHQSALPVMVWIHGGGLVEGAGSIYDPTPMVRKGVIVVTINYRLGYLGFFAESAIDAEGHLNGNYGFMDQQFALRWVRQNIASFGGDPNRVTIFGESAGGQSVYSNLASPTAKGLFSGAIADSGSYGSFAPYLESIISLADGETSGDFLVPPGDTVASNLGCATAACLRALLAFKLIRVQPGTVYPFVDGTLLTQTLGAAFASGNFNRVPVISGTNHDEWRAFVALEYDASGRPILTAAQYVAATNALWGPLAPAVLAAYPFSSYPSGGVALGASGTDGIFACQARSADRSLSEFVNTYAFEFNDQHAPPVFPGLSFPLGAYHGAELQYLFVVGGAPAIFTPQQQQLSDAMISYWTTFAKTGDPNSAGEPSWSPYSSATDQFQSLIPPAPTVESAFDTDHKCSSFWDLVP